MGKGKGKGKSNNKNKNKNKSKNVREAEHVRFVERVTIEKYRKKSSIRKPQLSLHGGYRQAMKRNFGHTGCAAMLRTYERAGNWGVVSGWERVLSCALRLQARDVYAAHYEYLRAMGVPGAREVQCDVQNPRSICLSYESHTIRGDGTNAAVGTAKAHTAEIRSTFHHLAIVSGEGENEDEGGVYIPDTNRTYWADLAHIPDNIDGAMMRSIYLKQIKGTGLRDWIDESLWYAPQRLSTSTSDNVPQQVHIRWFVFGSDQRPDEKSATSSSAWTSLTYC